MEPLGSRRYRITFTADAALHEKLERLQALTQSAAPGADLAKAIDRAVTRELDRLEAKRFGKTKAPRKRVGATDATVMASIRLRAARWVSTS